MLNPQHRKSDKRDDAVVKRVSRKNGDEGEHNSAWKVAFADFCLALMCLFLVLWVMAARQQELLEEVMRAPGGSVMDEGQGLMPQTLGGPRGSLIDRQPWPRRGDAVGGTAVSHGGGEPTDPVRDPFAPKVRYETQSELDALARTLERLSVEAGLAGNLLAVTVPTGLRVMLHDTDRQGMFELGSWVPEPAFRRLLRRMGPIFARMENQMLIVGHTDSLRYADRGPAAFSNWTLSTNRAMAARSDLLSGGMPADSILQVVGMADRAPLDVDNAAAGVNRRIELLILTSAQARTVSAMFGVPRAVHPLIDGADMVVPDHEAARALRLQLTAATGNGVGAE